MARQIDYTIPDLGNYEDGEEKPKFNPTKQLIHESIEIIHSKMDDRTRSKVVVRLLNALDQYELLAVRHIGVRRLIYEMYNSKVNDDLAISTLSRDFNMSLQGHNSKLSHHVKELLFKACEADLMRDYMTAIRCILEARLRYDILLSKSMVAAIGVNSSAAFLLIEIHDCRRMLFASIVKMVSDLAIKRCRPLSGDVIEEADLIQEALALASEAISRYRPDFTNKDDAGTTFTDYIYRTVSGNLNHYVVDSSRNVRVPRSAIDRARPVYYALDKLGTTDCDVLAAEATRILADIRLRNARRKLIQDERYSAEEVYDILAHTQDEASLDAVISTDEFGNENTFGELLPSKYPLADEAVDALKSHPQLITILIDYCQSEEEEEVMTTRWGAKKYRGLKLTADLYKEKTCKPMNKTRVSEIEQSVFGRIREAVAAGRENRIGEVREAVEGF